MDRGGRDGDMAKKDDMEEGREETYHPAGVLGGFSGIGSVAVILRQWYLHNTGICTDACHFFDTCTSMSHRKHISFTATPIRLLRVSVVEQERREKKVEVEG